MRNHWARLISLGLDAFAPRRCGGCGAATPGALCEACLAAIEGLPSPPRLPELAAPVIASYAGFIFEEPVRRVVHEGKYRGARSALHQLAVICVTRLRAAHHPPDLIIPVPLGRHRRRERGYNQAEIIASAFATSLGVPLGDGLIRRRETLPQVGGERRRRCANVAGAFAWRGSRLNGEQVWVIDDVITTGSTAESAARVVAAAGAGDVRVAALALVQR